MLACKIVLKKLHIPWGIQWDQHADIQHTHWLWKWYLGSDQHRMGYFCIPESHCYTTRGGYYNWFYSIPFPSGRGKVSERHLGWVLHDFSSPQPSWDAQTGSFMKTYEHLHERILCGDYSWNAVQSEIKTSCRKAALPWSFLWGQVK